MSNYIWPEEFGANVVDFSDYSVNHILAMQLLAWGNVFTGCPRPDNFFEVMDAASKVTNAFTPDQCKSLSDTILSNRSDEDDSNEDED